MGVRCKFTVTYKVPNTEGGADRIILSPVTQGSPENEKFFKYTPGGTLEFWTTNPEAAAQLEQGKSYYVDITEAT